MNNPIRRFVFRFIVVPLSLLGWLSIMWIIPLLIGDWKTYSEEIREQWEYLIGRRSLSE